jgi:hypothetical protein
VVTAVFYAAGAAQDAIGFLPPWDWTWWSVLLVGGSFTVLWTAVDLVARSRWLAAWAQPVGSGAADDVAARSGGASTR